MKQKILVCAYACLGAPDKRFASTEGGEGNLGWNIVCQIDRFCQQFVVTHIQNKQSIEDKLIKNPLPNTKFYYFSLPLLFDNLQKFHGGVQIYAYLWQIKAYFVAKKLHKEINFDIFHHITYANDWMASFIGALLPILYIRGPGGGAQKVPNMFLDKFSLAENMKEKLRDFGQWVFRHDPYFIISQNRAKAILVCNKEAFNALPEKWQVKAQIFPVNGIHFNDFKNFIKNDNGGNFVIVTAGRLIKIKGFDLAIRAFADFNKKAVNSKLVIFGNGPEMHNLKNLAESLGVENKVIFQGWLPRQELLFKMVNADLFLFPSLRDGGGNVVVEAMAAGLPVICFDLAGPGMHIDQTCGIKIKADNPEKAILNMTKALEELYFNKELRLQLSNKAKEKAKNEYDWDKLGDKLIKIYKDSYVK